MEKGFDNQKLREELINLYEEFIKNPENPEIMKKLEKAEGKYSGLIVYKDIVEDLPYTEEVIRAISELPFSIQYGLGTFSKGDLILKAKEVLKELKKFL